MKRLIALVVILLIVSGCAAGTDTETPVMPDLPYGVTRFVDHEAQVVCWKYTFANGAGLACLPLAYTALDEQYR